MDKEEISLKISTMLEVVNYDIWTEGFPLPDEDRDRIIAYAALIIAGHQELIPDDEKEIYALAIALVGHATTVLDWSYAEARWAMGDKGDAEQDS